MNHLGGAIQLYNNIQIPNSKLLILGSKQQYLKCKTHIHLGKNYKKVNTIIFENLLRGSRPFVYICIARTGGKDLEHFNKQVIYTSLRRILFVCVSCIFILLEYIKIVHIVHIVRIYY